MAFFEAKTMDDCLEKPRCILCYERIQKGETYHTLQWNDLTHYFHEECYKKELGRHG